MAVTKLIERQMPMEVLCLGMGRTGTATMKAALTRLGYSTAHGFDMHENPDDGIMWQKAIRAKYSNDTSIDLNQPEFWDKLLGHRSAVTDTPCNMFGPELINAYPEAKVILVERDVEAWYPSWERALIRPIDHPWLLKISQMLDWSGLVRKTGPVVTEGVMKGQFRAKDTQEYRANAREIYAEHYAELREKLKDQPHRLLEFNLAEGWRPLCEFLDQEDPKGPFPRVNEGLQHDEMIVVVTIQLAWSVLKTLMLWTLPIIVGVIIWSYQ